MGANRAIRQLRFYLPNFHDYIGDPVRYTCGDQIRTSRGRLTFTVDGWTILLDQSPDVSRLQQLLKQHGGYGIGHCGAITRTNGDRFKISQASDIWSTLHFFFSLMRGLWSGPIIATGMGRRLPVSTEWGSWRISDWQGVASWYPKGQPPAGLDTAFSGFRRLWKRPEWNEPLRELVHWYIEANRNVAAVEGSLILTHTALELLAWMWMIVDKRRMSIAAFGRLGSSAARIEAALTRLRVPFGFPPRS